MKKSFITMKATRLLSGLGIVFCVTAVAPPAVLAQKKDPLQTNISIEAEKQPLEKLLMQIVASTQVKLAYDVNEIKKYTVTLRDKKSLTVEDLLKRVLQQTNLTYETQSNTIVIYEKARTNSPETGFNSGFTVSNASYRVQKQTIEGTVMDENGPLQNASVFIKGAGNGTVTNEKGFFSIESDDAETQVTIMLVGYQTKNTTVKSGTSNVIVLLRSVAQLDSVVVVGYGTQQRTKVTGAVSKVLLDKVTSRSVNNPVEILQGKVAGVYVQNNGGDPTVGPSVNVRGLGGINGEQALWVVDGVAFYSGAPLVNPNDIESMSVLKDAAAAIYGARASGGVILVTTKKGKSGASTVNVDAKYGTQEAWRKLHSLNANDYAETMNLAADNAGRQRDPAFDATVYPEGHITQTDWMDDVFRKGTIQEYNVSLSGGNEKSTHYLSFGYRDNEGILLNTRSQRAILRLNTDYQVKKWLKIGENLSYTVTGGRGANTTSTGSGAILMAIAYPTNVAPYTSTGAYSGVPEQYAGSYGDVLNPVALLMRNDYTNPINTLYFNPYAEINIIKGLTFRSNFSYTYGNNFSKNFQPRILESGKKFYNNYLDYSSGNWKDLLAEQILTYTHRFGKSHNLSANFIYAYQENVNNSFAVQGQNLPDEREDLLYLGNATEFPNKPSSGRWQESLLSYAGRIAYDFRNKYMVTASIRRDGTSKIPSQNRWQWYPAVTAGWRIKEEDFLQKSLWLSDLKLRGSYGILGNLGSLPSNAFNVPLAATTAYIGQTPAGAYGYAEDAISNPDLKWAQSRQTNIGLDAAFFNSHFTVGADYFIKKTEDMLLPVSLPGTAGVSQVMWKNVGSAEDRGVELSLGYQNVTKGGLQYSVNANLSSIKNKVVSLDEFSSFASGGDVRGVLTPGRVAEGQPLYAYYVVPAAGLFKTQQEIDSYVGKDGSKIQPNAVPGNMKFKDVNGDGKIDNNDRQFMGSAYPSFSYGFSFNLSYKGFDLNMFLQGAQGNKIFNALKFLGQSASVQQGFNLLNSVKNAWTPENPNADIPRVSLSDPNGDFGTTSSWYIENGSYMRIKNLTLGYTLPVQLTKKAGLNTVRMYVTANNLVTFTNYSGFDPEVGLDQYGIDKGRYPQARSIFIGLNINL